MTSEPEIDAEHARGVVAPAGRRRQGRDDGAAEGERSGLGGAVPALAHREALADRGHAAGVIGVAVGDDDGGQAQDAAIPQERGDDAFAGVEPVRTAGAGVDQHGLPVRSLDDDRVALADVEHRDAKSPVGRPQRRPQRHQHAGGGESPGRPMASRRARRSRVSRRRQAMSPRPSAPT